MTVSLAPAPRGSRRAPAVSAGLSAREREDRGAAPPPAPLARGGRTGSAGDRVFRYLTGGFAAVVIALVLGMALQMALVASPALRHFGWGFLAGTTWDPANDVYGALPFLFGTVVSSLLALALAVPLALGIAGFLSELAPARVARVLGFLVELLAAVPSVIFGLWGIFVLAPALRAGPQAWLSAHLGSFPLFSGPPYGLGMMTAGLILAIMILPTISSICLEVFRAVPRAQREAALALGATRWETTRMAVLSYARSGILGAVILGLGRALGETMAVTMVIGNRPAISASLLAPGYTMASVIANEFSEASGDLYVSALVAVALVLLALTFLLNAGARWLVWRTTRGHARFA